MSIGENLSAVNQGPPRFFRFLMLNLLLVLGCSDTTEDAGDDRSMKTRSSAKSIEELLDEKNDEWLAIPGIIATSISEADEGKPCILILAEKKTAEITKQIPSSIDGFPIVIEADGQLEAVSD